MPVKIWNQFETMSNSQGEISGGLVEKNKEKALELYI